MKFGNWKLDVEALEFGSLKLVNLKLKVGNMPGGVGGGLEVWWFGGLVICSLVKTLAFT